MMMTDPTAVPGLPDASWLKAYAAALNESPVYRREAATWSYGPVGIVVRGVGPEQGGRERRFAGVLDLVSGTCRAAYVTTESDARACATVLEGTVEDWQRVARGDLDATQALFENVIRVEGRLSGLMRYLRGAQSLLRNATLIGADAAKVHAERHEGHLQPVI